LYYIKRPYGLLTISKNKFCFLKIICCLLFLTFKRRFLAESRAPTIQTHPSDTTRNEGQTVTLVCSVSGKPTPTVQWYKDGQVLNISADPRLTKDPGSSSLTITNLIRSDEGGYVCTATNNISISSSNQGFLEVNCEYEYDIDRVDFANVTRKENTAQVTGYLDTTKALTIRVPRYDKCPYNTGYLDTTKALSIPGTSIRQRPLQYRVPRYIRQRPLQYRVPRYDKASLSYKTYSITIPFIIFHLLLCNDKN
jgi:hypothetical protein